MNKAGNFLTGEFFVGQCYYSVVGKFVKYNLPQLPLHFAMFLNQIMRKFYFRVNRLWCFSSNKPRQKQRKCVSFEIDCEDNSSQNSETLEEMLSQTTPFIFIFFANYLVPYDANFHLGLLKTSIAYTSCYISYLCK